MDIEDAKKRVAVAETAIAQVLYRLCEDLDQNFDIPSIHYEVHDVQRAGRKPSRVFKVILSVTLKG